jgi:cytochrome c oxidase assembly factor CtaG
VNWEREKERDKDRDPVGDVAVGELLLWPFSSNSWCSKPWIAIVQSNWASLVGHTPPLFKALISQLKCS